MFEDKFSADKSVGNLVADLYEVSRKYSNDGGCDYSDESISKLEKLKDAVRVWGIESTSVDVDRIDRMSNMFGGNPFTSSKHPWLKNDGGDPLYPLVQVNLRQLSELSANDFGSGLLQIWLDIDDPDLPSIVRVVEPSDFNDLMRNDYPDDESIEKIDKYGAWFSISRNFKFEFFGFMLTHFGDGDIDWSNDRDLSEEELDILARLEDLSEEHGYRSLNGNWLMGYPSRSSGTPAGRYDSEPANLIQFSAPDAFPMVNVSRYANVFYWMENGDTGYFFDWNG